MRIVSPLLKHVVYPGLSKAGYLRWPAESGPAVLTYHGVFPQAYSPRDSALDGHLITAEAFRSQLSLFKSKYNVISPEQFRLWCGGQIQLPPRAVLLTCDDGLLNTLTDMLPIIREFDVPFLFFVTSASASEEHSMLWYERLYLWLVPGPVRVSIEMPRHWDRYLALTDRQKPALWQELTMRLSSLDPNAREDALEQTRIQIGISENWHREYSQNESLRRRFFMMNRTDLRSVADTGVTVGAHTVSHPMLSQMTDDQAFWEISEGRARLQNALGREVWALAYPFGTSQAVGAREAGMAHRAGFQCALMNTESNSGDKFRLPRIHVSDGMSLTEIEAHLCGLHRLIRETFSQLTSD